MGSACPGWQNIPPGRRVGKGGVAAQAVGQRDSAVAYSRFLRFWDKADPELQGRVREARAGLEQVTGDGLYPGKSE